jgi:hypothetical protein
VKNRVILLFFCLLISSGLWFFVPPLAFAQDNNNLDPTQYTCTISVNGVGAVISSDSSKPGFSNVPIAPTSGSRGILFDFPISVTLPTAVQESVENCSGTDSPTLQIASDSVSDNGGWENSTLTYSNGTYTGNITTPAFWNENYVIALDVETPSSSSCGSQQPLCRRAYIRFDTESFESDELQCGDKQSALATALTEALPQVRSTNESVQVTIQSEVVADAVYACAGEYATMEIFSVETNEVVARGNFTDGRGDLTATLLNPRVGNYRVYVMLVPSTTCFDNRDCSHYTITRDFCVGLAGSEDGCTPLQTETQEGVTVADYKLCEQIPNLDSQQKCATCYTNQGIWTAIGCVPQNPAQAIGVLIRIGLNIAGGVALIMILVAGFMFTTSQGNPKRTDEAKEMMQSAVIGLFFIIFSVTILQFIGSDLLKIPGFGGN